MNSKLTRLNQAEIAALLPHRGIALFLIDAMVDGSHVEGSAYWPASHPHLVGHFPGLPVVPGVFLIDAAAQLAGVGLASQGDPGTKVGMLAGVKRCLLHQPVRPEEHVYFTLDLKSGIPDRIYCAEGIAKRNDGKKVLTVELSIAIVNRDEIKIVI
jgi:3-hydroxyacyl-[acyl-carrier-protein] dehydratase